MNSMNLRLSLITTTFVLLGTFISCNDTKVGKEETRDMELSLAAENKDVTLSGADEGRVFTIRSTVAAPKNRLVKLVATASSPNLSYFTADEVTLPMGGYETQAKIIFKSKAIEELGSEVNIAIQLECEGVKIGGTPLSYNVKYTPKEKPVEEEVTVSVKSKATEILTINGSDVSSEIEVSLDKKSSKDVVVELSTSGALTSRYTLSNDQLIIKAGETSATTSIIFLNAEFIYTTSKADVKIDIDCKTAKLNPTASSVTVSAVGTTAITIPNSTMSAYNNTMETINLSEGNKEVRMPIWNVEETAEDMVFLFEVIGAEYGKSYGNNFNAAMPIVRISKYSGTGSMGSTDFYVEFYASAFAKGTHNVKIRGTIISGPARFGDKATDETTEINVTIIK